jgi:signal transduction histidine kinase
MPTLHSVNITNLVQQSIEDLKQNFKNRTVSLEAKEDISIKADSTLIEVAITNLIENALKYSEDDVHVKITKESITITDSGIGINSHDLEKITKKFYRVSQNEWNNSLGLGLSIVSNILELHHFKLLIQSEENSGSVFTIKF